MATLPEGTSVEGVSAQELRLAARNHALPLEALRHPITPAGLHYLLIHYDIPAVDPADFVLDFGGAVERPLSFSLDELRARERVSLPVTFECAGNGRALLEPRPVSQPWLTEAVGTAEWAGAALGPLLEEVGVKPGAVEALFTGLDRGVEGGEAQAYERALPVSEAFGGLLAYEMNGAPLLPQHGFPLRLVVPGWYGMQNVKWLTRITLLEEPFEGYQNAVGYRMYDADGNPGEPVTRMLPRSLTMPPGIPDFMTRERMRRARPADAPGPGLVGPRTDRACRGLHRRRRDLRGRGARRADRRGRLGGLALRLARRARQLRGVVARDRRRRQRPAARPALEPQGLREQRGRAARGRGRPGAPGLAQIHDRRDRPAPAPSAGARPHRHSVAADRGAAER